MREGRFEEIKNRRNDAVESIADKNNEKDKGLIRKEVFHISKEKDKELSTEEKKEISDRMIGRYFLDYGISKKGNNTCVDAVHSQMANTGEIVRILKRKPEWQNTTREEIINKEVAIAEDILNIKKDNPQGDIFSVINKLIEKYRDDELSMVILKIKKLHEDYLYPLVSEIAKKSDSYYFIARKTRRFMDANRPEDDRKISDKNIREEFGYGYYDSQYQLLKKFSENSLDYQEDKNEMHKPFLHISLHGKSDKPDDSGDIIIANGLRNGNMPCDPQIARWFSDRLNDKIKEKGLVKNNDEYYSSGIAKEGERFCGNIVHTERRFGSKAFDALGSNYQYIQVELCLPLRKKYLSELQEIISEILEEFQEQFRNTDDLNDFLNSTITPEDSLRLAGKIYTEAIYTPDVSKEIVRLNKNYRLALGVEVGETVLINKKEFTVEDTTGDESKSRRPILNIEEKFIGQVIIEKINI